MNPVAPRPAPVHAGLASKVAGLNWPGYSGFSTARDVTKDAGRGVGMDVIAEIAARLGGRISLNSEIGKNMRLSLSFPAQQNAAGVVAA